MVVRCLNEAKDGEIPPIGGAQYLAHGFLVASDAGEVTLGRRGHSSGGGGKGAAGGGGSGDGPWVNTETAVAGFAGRAGI